MQPFQPVEAGRAVQIRAGWGHRGLTPLQECAKVLPEMQLLLFSPDSSLPDRVPELIFLFNLRYMVSHGKVNTVIWLCWGYSFWFLLIFWALWAHEKGTFMPNSSVLIFLVLSALYGSISQYFLFLNKFGIILTFRGLFQAIKSNKPSKIYIFL